MDILGDLTDRQREAATHGDGPLLVVAGAGSGKTRVVTRRVAYLAAGGVPAYRILAITFTNKAADEMRHRVAELAGATGAWISTFHSMCARMLRQFPDLLGFAHPFTIYDRKDSIACIKTIADELGLAGSGSTPQSLMAAISRAKNKMVGPDAYADQAVHPNQERTAQVYKLYDQACRKNNSLDFDDLLLRAAELLTENEDFRTYWQTRFQHVLIDEYQDTNRPQYVIAHVLSAGHRNICATGDPDQSIYTWRGADIRNILDFKDDYPDARTVKLEENFRSTKMILLAASGVIEKNEARIERGLWTHNEAGAPVQLVESARDIDEADAIAAGVRASLADGFAYGGMAVFYRTHAQSRVIEASLRDAGIPYTILDALEFYNRKEIKDVVAYLKVIVNPSDGVSLLRIINEPRRGIGARTVERLAAYAASKAITIGEAISGAESVPGLAQGARKKLTDFGALLARLRELPRAPVAELVREVLEQTDYLGRLKRSESEEDAARAQNVEELVNAAAEFDMDYPDAELEIFLERVTLVSDSDIMTSEQGRVMLMTLHSAKGLEFPVVFMAGVEEGLLPHVNAFGSRSRIEEERRLCYVGMTRTKKRLFLHWAAERLTYGQLGFSMRSRFINEIPAEARQEVFGAAMAADEREFADGAAAEKHARDGERFIEYDKDVVKYDELEFGVHDVVRHPMFGRGTVVSVSGTGARATVVVDFSGRKRHLVLQFANLVRIG